MDKPLYGAVVVPQLAAQAAIRLRPQMRTAAVVVMEGVRPHARLYSASLPALALGLTPGMTRVEVESFPGVHILPRSLSAETAAALIVLEAAGLFTPRIERCAAETSSLECLLDLSGTERLLGAPAALGRKILDHLVSLGFAASIALCENADAALSLARAEQFAVTAPAQTNPYAGRACRVAGARPDCAARTGRQTSAAACARRASAPAAAG